MKLMKLDRIAIDPDICLGMPRVRGTRVTVDFVLKLVSSGYTATDLLHAYPELETDDIEQCVAYGQWRDSGSIMAV